MTLGEFGSQCVLVRVAVTKPIQVLEQQRIIRQIVAQGDALLPFEGSRCEWVPRWRHRRQGCLS